MIGPQCENLEETFFARQTLDQIQRMREERIAEMERSELSAASGLTDKDILDELRGAGIRPQVFPEPTDRALLRFAHTLGHVDLILVSATAGELSLATLARVSHLAEQEAPAIAQVGVVGAELVPVVAHRQWRGEIVRQGLEAPEVAGPVIVG